jgi:hypothetical protein
VHVAVLSNVGIPPAEVALQELKSAAKRLKIEVHSVEINEPDDFERAADAHRRRRPSDRVKPREARIHSSAPSPFS